MITEEDVNNILSLIKSVEKQAFDKNFDPSMFSLMLQCLCRTPLGSLQKLTEIINMVKCLLDAGMDYSLLLKAGILMGQFPDYQRAKQKRYQKYRRSRAEQKVEEELREFQKKISDGSMEIYNGEAYFSIDTSWLARLRSILFNNNYFTDKKEQLYRTYWSRLPMENRNLAADLSPEKFDFQNLDLARFYQCWHEIIYHMQEEKMQSIKNLLKLDENIWELDFSSSSFLGCHISLRKKTIPDEHFSREVKHLNPYDSRHFSINDSEFVYCDEYCDPEPAAFISIFQNSVWFCSSRIFPITHALEHYYAAVTGIWPDQKLLNTLRKRFYRFIKKTYHHDAVVTAKILDRGFYQEMHSDGVFNTAHKSNRFIFYITSRSQSQETSAIASGGRLFYDVKKNRYFLLDESRLSKQIDQISDTGIAEFIENNMATGSIVKLEDGSYRVKKKIEIHSPSKAAWLVCGYKRNGLDAWKNRYQCKATLKKQTLRQVLEDLKKKKKSLTTEE